MTTTTPRTAPAASSAPRRPQWPMVLSVMTLVLSGGMGLLFVVLWFSSAAQGDFALLMGLLALGAILPLVLLVGFAVVLAALCARRGENIAMWLSIASIVCQLPVIAAVVMVLQWMM
ncbi:MULTISPECIES: hypothetical protein [Microbacterium]|uniref:hypothetical protein n=1 Tax=Microbacterium TaxID=33882 RepID=UPI00114425C9|nr:MULTISPECIES: hypothetical protein [Microbacterium]MCC9054204.1 hypothetical protein [Microbacterium sp. F2E]GEB93855.1 hypothetical protein MLA01_00740 [Microbacterium lacticum]GGN11210.1 hypothetical protein GCM10009724_00400 [Microbacterium lacticum]